MVTCPNYRSSNKHTEQCHTEYYFNHPITIYNEKDENQLSFAEQIASIKTLKNNTEPFFVMDVGRAKRMIDFWTQTLPRVKPFYSVNCNADPVLLHILSENPSIGFNCTNQKSLEDVLEVAGSDRVVYSNLVLNRSALYQAASCNVNTLTFQSECDLHRIMCYYPETMFVLFLSDYNEAEISRLLLNICINPESSDSNALMGCQKEEALSIIRFASVVGAHCVGISFNLGNDCVNPGIYKDAIQFCSNLIIAVRMICGIELSVMNIGGGFSTQNSGPYACFQEVCDQINSSLDYHLPQEKFPNLRIIATPGRFFAASVYSLVTNIIDRRTVDASEITENEFDAGNDAFLYQINEGFYGSFGCKMVSLYQPTCAPLIDNEITEHAYGSVLGPFGFESDLDIVQRCVKFRPLCVGDWLIWADMGAYTLNNSGCLGNEEMDIPTPEIFYFSSQDKWDHLMACKGRSERKDTVDGSEDELTLSDDESVLPSAGDDRDIYIHNGDMDMDGNEDIDDFFCFFD